MLLYILKTAPITTQWLQEQPGYTPRRALRGEEGGAHWEARCVLLHAVVRCNQVAEDVLLKTGREICCLLFVYSFIELMRSDHRLKASRKGLN